MSSPGSGQPSTPLQLFERFGAAVNAGDIDALMAFYEPEAIFVWPRGREATGPEQVRDAVEEFVALRPRLGGDLAKVLTVGDVALVLNRWTLEGTQPDGAPVEMCGRSVGVLRRGADGGWRIVIDDPWGCDAASGSGDDAAPDCGS